MAAPTTGFLAERLAKATAVPAEQRSADVRAFIETCQLQAELAEELGLPEAIRYICEWRSFWRRWTAAPALKLVRSHFVSLGTHLMQYFPQLHDFAIYSVYLRSSFKRTGTWPSDLGRELTELLERDPSLETLAVLAAGITGVKPDRGWERGLLKMSNSAVALMRRPAVRRRLQSELAALSHQLVSYEELLAFFINYGSQTAIDLLGDGVCVASADIQTAMRLAMELLPQLAPDNPKLRFAAASMAKHTILDSHDTAAAFHTRYITMLPAALAVARQQGNDKYYAACGYHLASAIDWLAESDVHQGLPPPSAVLGWLQQAGAAHRRCKALLPKQWTSVLDGLRVLAAPARACLQHLQQEGDRWRRLTPAEQQELNAAAKSYHKDLKDPNVHTEPLLCSGCNKWAPQLRTCGACREAQYCSVDCQKAHWKEHKARCKEVQAAKAAARGGASGGSS